MKNEVTILEAYPVFITVRLAEILDIINKDTPYDIQWSEAITLYNEFLKSKFNDDMRSEYDCIEKFLNIKI